MPRWPSWSRDGREREREREREKAPELCQPASTMAVAGDSVGGEAASSVCGADKVRLILIWE